jgi:PAS domain S-box-containing protein
VKQGQLVTSLTIIMTDITIKKQAEEALRRSEHIYRQAITTAGAVPYYRDHRTNTYTFMGEGILAMTGYSASEMTPELWETLEQEGFPRGSLAHLTYEEADRVTDEDSSLLWECDYRIRTRDGQTRWVADTSVKGFNEYGEQAGVIGILQDITERKQFEQQIQQRLQELAAIQAVSQAAASELESDTLFDLIAHELFQLFDIQDVYFAIHDQQTNLIQFPYYRHAEQLLDSDPIPFGQGLSSHVILSRKPLLINHDYERRSTELGVVRFSAIPGSISQVSWLGVPIQAGDQTIGMVCVINLERENAFTDDDVRLLTTIAANVGIAIQNAQLFMTVQQELTGRKQAEAERETFIQELEAKNAELERFNYTVSHELKSPIVTIKGFLGSIAKDIRDEKYERAQKDLLRISNATDKMHDTLSDLLELSRIGRIVNPPEEVDLLQLTREALETVHGRIQSRNITVQIAPDLPVVCGDRVRLREVYENLIDNAAKHFGDQPAPLIEIGVRKDGDENVYFIKDNGLGIDAKYHKRIFGLFDKLDATSEGTGIGLAIVKRIIETHGGRIWVESDGPGKGSTFCFTIPGK